MTDYKCKKCGAKTDKNGKCGDTFTKEIITYYGKKETIVKCNCKNIVYHKIEGGFII